MIKGSRRVKDLIKNKAKGDSSRAQALQRHYAMERFLERISVSDYRDNFILKGGMLVSSMVGLDLRSTMDVDTTLKGTTLSPDKALAIIKEIASIPLDDDMEFEVEEAQTIMEDSEYSGVRIPVVAHLDRMKIKLKIDISTGDAITPSEINYKYPLMFEDRTINIWAYNLETSLAEKIETAISRGILNTRMRDFYDIYMLLQTYETIDEKVFAKAIRATAEHRGRLGKLSETAEIIEEIERTPSFSVQWERYLKGNPFAAEVEWHDALASFRKLCEMGDLI